jgi:Virus neck protein
VAEIVNRYFKHGTVSEQYLFESLKTEAIQVMGRKYYYLPRKVQIMDLVLGEDILSKFDVAIPLEMYMENVLGFEGDKEIFSKFGLEVHNSFKLVVSQKRWDKEVGDVEGANMIVGTRPNEGDLVYDPLTKFLFEIKFVDHDSEFYQVGKNYLWSLSCETFRYSSEDLSTGIEEIDNIELANTFDLLQNQLLMEDGNMLMQENCKYLLLDIDPAVLDEVNEIEYDKSEEFLETADDIEWSVENPFSGL